MQSRKIFVTEDLVSKFDVWSEDLIQHQDNEWEPKPVIIIGSETCGFSTINIDSLDKVAKII